MPEIPGAVLGALAVLAGVLIYIFAWRATRGASAVMQLLVRGVPLILVAAAAALATMIPAAQQSFDRTDTELARPSRTSEYEKYSQERLPSEDAEGERLDAAAPPAANGEPMPRPLIVEPPPGTEPAPLAPEPLPEVAAPEAPAAPPPPPPASAEAPRARALGNVTDEQAFQLVPVFYGTDREEQADPKRVTYNAERGRRLDLGRALVTVPKVHEVPQIERPWTLRIPYFNVVLYQEAEDPNKHFTIQEIRKLSREDFLRFVRERLSASDRFKGHALVFVHGYNTAFDYALYRTAQIAYDLKFDGATFAYSWPSGGAVASYTYDRESAGASRPYLRQFLELVVKETGAKAISLIAHSMGNQPLLEVLKDMRSSAPEGVVINQMILAAPDVDTDNFSNLAATIQGLANGVTLYAASNDRALIVSRNFWQNPRAGDVTANGPIIVPGVDTIDVTAASTDVFALNHSGYAEHNELLQDIGKLIHDGVRPPDARSPSLKRLNTGRGDYWRFTAP
jgi:esterase/lipase superfamily enzyme